MGTWKRRWIIIGRTLFWLVLFIGGWAFFASLLGLPGPSSALRAGLRVAKSATDGVYLWAKEESLEEAAEEVRSAAVEQDNDTALIEFQRLVERFPESPKVPGALLTIGYIQHAAGDLEAAQAPLSRVARDYPGTPAADMATQRLQRIKREVR